jgi:cell division protein FtsN
VDYIAPGDNQPEQEAAKPENPESLYRVQVGAYRNRTYAEKRLAEVKAAGFADAYINKG